MKILTPTSRLLSLGAIGLTVASAVQAQNLIDSKPWSLRFSQQGFYTDNVFSRSFGNSPRFDANGTPVMTSVFEPTPGKPGEFREKMETVTVNGLPVSRPVLTPVLGFGKVAKVQSYGFEISPGFSVRLPINDGQTTLSFSYDYLLRYFDNRPKSADHNHTVNVGLVHNFDSKNKLEVTDSFVVAQEPEQLGTGSGAAPITFRAEGSNVRNIAGFDFSSQLSERWSSTFGLRNNYFSFENDSLQDSLGRYENLPSANARFLLTPSTSLGLLYQFGMTRYDGSVSKVRDLNSHFVAGTIDVDFGPNVKTSLRGGIQVNDFADPIGYTDRDGVTPYADALVSYSFASGSSLALGVRHQVSVTDVGAVPINGDNILNVGKDGLDPIRGSSATSARISLLSEISPNLLGAISGIYQIGTFIGGGPTVDGQNDAYASIDFSLTYRLTQNVGIRGSFAHDRVESDLSFLSDSRPFSRNRVYLGVNFSY